MGKRIESPAFLVQPRVRVEAMRAINKNLKALGVRVAKDTIARLQGKPSQAQPRKPIPKKRKGPPRRKSNGNVTGGHKLRPIVEDRQYLDALRDDACIFTGLKAAADDPVEPMHMGNPGKGLKSDEDALPARHSVHDLTHRHGITAILPYLEARPDLLLGLLRAYARERYRLTMEENT